MLTALRSPGPLHRGRRRGARRPALGGRRGRIVVDGETFEVYPNRDSVPFVVRVRLPDDLGRADLRPRHAAPGRLERAWAPVFDELDDGDDERITALAAELAERHPTTAADRDRVVLAVALDVRATDGTRYAGEGRLDVNGTEAELATPRVVSVPLAGGIEELLAGRFAPGLHRAAAEPAAVRRWLDFLAAHGIATPVRRLDRD